MTGAWRTIRRNDPADQYPERTDPSSPEFVVLACRTAARLAVAQGASAGDLREVLEALGLVEPVSRSNKVDTAALTGSRETESDTPTTKPAPKAAPRKTRAARDTSLCGKGRHRMTGDNVRIRADGRRRCRACTREWGNGERHEAEPAPPPIPAAPGKRMCGAGEHPLPYGGECLPCKNRRSQESRRRNAIARARAVIAEIPMVEASPVDACGAPILRCAKRLHHNVGVNRGKRKSGVGPCLPCRKITRARQILFELTGEEA